MKRLSSSLIFFLAIVELSAQEIDLPVKHWSMPPGFFDKNRLLQIEFDDSILHLNYRAAEIEFIVRVHNQTTSSLLLYGFTDIHEGSSDLENYMQRDIGGGITPYVLDSNDSIIGKSLGLDEEQICGRVITGRTIERAIEKAGTDLYGERILLKKKSNVDVKFKVTVEPSRSLKPGSYKFFLLFYCGRNIINLVDDELIKKDMAKSHAKLYQGYTISDSVRLIVH